MVLLAISGVDCGPQYLKLRGLTWMLVSCVKQLGTGSEIREA
jgi:hypothetical protein